MKIVLFQEEGEKPFEFVKRTRNAEVFSLLYELPSSLGELARTRLSSHFLGSGKIYCGLYIPEEMHEQKRDLI